MTSRRRQRRPDARAARLRRLGIAGLAALVLGGLMLPTGAITLTDFSRGANVGVATDSAAELGMAINSSVGNCQRERLVDVTNNFFPSIDVTVTLADASAGTLYNSANGDSGTAVTFALASGASATVELEANYTGSLPASVGFDVDGAGTGVSVQAARSTTIDGNCPPVGDFTMTRAGGNKLDVNASLSSDQDGTIGSYEWYVNDDTASGNPDATGETATLNPVRTGDTVTLVVTDDDGATHLVTKTAP